MGSRGRHEIPWGWSYRQLSADVGAGYQNQVLCKGSKHSSKQIPWHFGDCLNTTSHWRPSLFLFRSVFSCCMAYNVHSEWRSPLLPTESFRRPAVLWSTSPRCLSLLRLFFLLQGGTDTGLVWSLWVVPSLWDRETVLPKCWNKLSVSSAEVLEKQSGVDPEANSSSRNFQQDEFGTATMLKRGVTALVLKAQSFLLGAWEGLWGKQNCWSHLGSCEEPARGSLLGVASFSLGTCPNTWCI